MQIHRSDRSVRSGASSGGFLRGGLSADGTLLCLEHAEHGDLIHPALRVLDPRTGATVGEQLDEGMSLAAQCWSPVAGDQRLAVRPRARRRHAARRSGTSRPASSRCSSSTSTARSRARLVARRLGAPAREHVRGPVAPLPLRHRERRARRRSRASPATSGRRASDPTAASGSCTSRARGSGSSSTTRARRSSTLGERAPASRPYESWHFENPHGQRVHGFFVTPDDSGGPFPVLMFVHGGPDLVRPRPLAARGAGVRRRGLRGRDGQLPRLDRLRARVARHAHREHRRARARGRERRARGPRRARHRRPGARRRRRALVGRVRHAARAGQAPGALALRHRGRPRRRLRVRVRGALAAPAGVRPGAPRRQDAEGGSGAHARPQRDQLRRRRGRARPLHHRPQRQPLPVRAGDGVRRQARRARAPARGVRVRDGARLVRRRRADSPGRQSTLASSRGTCPASACRTAAATQAG